MFSRFFKSKPAKPKPRTKAERRQQMLQRLRARHPDWSDAKLLHHAATFAAQPVVSERAQARARWQADVAAAMADGDKLLAQVNRNQSEFAAAREARERLVRFIGADGKPAEWTADTLLGVIRAIRDNLLSGKSLDPRMDRAKLEDGNRLAREHGLPEVA